MRRDLQREHLTLMIGLMLQQANFKQLAIDNSAANVGSAIRVTGVKNLIGPAGEDAVTELDRFSFTPRSPEAYTHDADGNLTADARWAYTWGGENHLITMETSASAATAGVPRQKLEFAYDGQSRRGQATVFCYEGHG